jgi:hypothetical protein
MALTVDFWGFGKQENSTEIPSTTPLKTYSTVLLKDNCSVVNPTLKINESMATNVFDWNYCYIHEFRRYYFISDWYWELGIWVAELQVDVLASFKTLIGLHTFYILRAQQDSGGNTLYDGNIVDGTYPCTAGAPTYTNANVTNPFAGLYADELGMYVVGIINKSAAGVEYYAFQPSAFREFCTKLFNYSTGWVNINPSEISEDLQKALINPFQYVVSALYLPIPRAWFIDNNIGTYTNTVEFGWWSLTTVNTNRKLKAGTLYQFTTSLTIPKHPSAYTRGAYLNLNPYSIYTLRYYPFGTFDIDSEAVCNWNTLDLYTDVDVCTGKAILTMAVAGKNNPIRTVETNIAVPVPTASVNVDYMNLGSRSTAIMAGASAVSQLGAGSSGNWFQNARSNAKEFIGNVRAGNWSAIGAGAKEAINNILSSAMASKATAEIMGQQGSYTLFDTQTLTLTGRFIPIAAEDITHRGRPLCQTRMINTMRGFIQCADADVAIPCTDREKMAIRSYLESGFYYD